MKMQKEQKNKNFSLVKRFVPYLKNTVQRWRWIYSVLR